MANPVATPRHPSIVVCVPAHRTLNGCGPPSTKWSPTMGPCTVYLTSTDTSAYGTGPTRTMCGPASTNSTADPLNV